MIFLLLYPFIVKKLNVKPHFQFHLPFFTIFHSIFGIELRWCNLVSNQVSILTIFWITNQIESHLDKTNLKNFSNCNHCSLYPLLQYQAFLLTRNCHINSQFMGIILFGQYKTMNVSMTEKMLKNHVCVEQSAR